MEDLGDDQDTAVQDELDDLDDLESSSSISDSAAEGKPAALDRDRMTRRQRAKLLDERTEELVELPVGALARMRLLCALLTRFLASQSRRRRR